MSFPQPQQLANAIVRTDLSWNVGVAYRIPDTTFNLQGSYQQGRVNVQLSCLLVYSISLAVLGPKFAVLGPDRFTNSFAPGNFCLSLYRSI